MSPATGSSASGAASAASGSGLGLRLATASASGSAAAFGLRFAAGFGAASGSAPPITTTVPPAPSISSTARLENAWACTVSFVFSSPVPRILTGWRSVRTTPAAFSSSGVTSVPASNASRLRTFTGVVCVRNGPIGIDIRWFGPGSLPSRMYSGIWPPSKPGRMLWLPERAFWPLCPRPDVLPLPEPWPRPTRLRSRWLPSAGFSVCSASGRLVAHLPVTPPRP